MAEYQTEPEVDVRVRVTVEFKDKTRGQAVYHATVVNDRPYSFDGKFAGSANCLQIFQYTPRSGPMMESRTTGPFQRRRLIRQIGINFDQIASYLMETVE